MGKGPDSPTQPTSQIGEIRRGDLANWQELEGDLAKFGKILLRSIARRAILRILRYVDQKKKVAKSKKYVVLKILT